MLVRILSQHHHDQCQTRHNNTVPVQRKDASQRQVKEKSSIMPGCPGVPVQTPCAECRLVAYDCISV